MGTLVTVPNGTKIRDIFGTNLDLDVDLDLDLDLVLDYSTQPDLCRRAFQQIVSVQVEVQV